MRFAAIETSTEWCSVALAHAGGIVCVERRAGNRHSELALPMLQRLLHMQRMTPADLQAVAFGAGPGSFTGLRIACGIAQGLALAHGIPALGVSSLEALAEESGAARVVACLDARMREVYYAALEKRAGRWHEVLAAQCVAPQALRAPGPGWSGAGNGFAAYGEAQFAGARLSRLLPQVHPSALAVARLAAPRLAAGEGVDAALAAPIYLRDKVAFTKAELDERRP